MARGESGHGMTVARLNMRLRKAVAADVARLQEVIEASVRGLQAADYSPAQIEGALNSVYGTDSQLIADGTFRCGNWGTRYRPSAHRGLRRLEQTQDALRRRSIC